MAEIARDEVIDELRGIRAQLREVSAQLARIDRDLAARGEPEVARHVVTRRRGRGQGTFVFLSGENLEVHETGVTSVGSPA